LAALPMEPAPEGYSGKPPCLPVRKGEPVVVAPLGVGLFLHSPFTPPGDPASVPLKTGVQALRVFSSRRGQLAALGGAFVYLTLRAGGTGAIPARSSRTEKG